MNNVFHECTTPTTHTHTHTYAQPCNTSGWFDPVLAGKYGLADFDWSTGRDIWANGHPMNNGEVLIEQVMCFCVLVSRFSPV